MAIQLTNETKSYSDDLAYTIKLLEIIEKHDLEVQIGAAGQFELQGNSNIFYETADLSKSFVMAIKLPITKQELKSGDNFDNSALKDFLDIKEIREDPVTEVLSIERSGDNFRFERYHTIATLDKLKFNIVDKYNTDEVRYRGMEPHFTFVDEEDIDVNGYSPQINLFIRFNPVTMLLDNSTYAYNYTGENSATADSYIHHKELILLETESYPARLMLGRESTSSVETNLLVLYVLYSIFQISKYNDLGLNGSFLNLISIAVGDLHLPLAGVQFSSKEDLSKAILKTRLVNTFDDSQTINAKENHINPLDYNTYARFLFIDSDTGTGDSVKSFSAYDIIPEVNKVKDILEIKKYIPSSNNLSSLKTVLFLPESNPTKESLFKSYLSHVDLSFKLIKEKWDRIITRVNKYSKFGYVPKITLALLFTRKYMWPNFNYSYNYRSLEQRIPSIFNYLELNLNIDVETFFDIPNFAGYFNDMSKAKAIVTTLDLYSNRFEHQGQVQHGYQNLREMMYFANSGVSQVNSRYVGRGRSKNIHLIINDSYMKQAWKPKIKGFVKSIGLNPDKDYVYVLETENKLETLMLKRILKDRPLVYQYSDFVASVKREKKTSAAKTIKSLVLDERNYDQFSKRKYWVERTPENIALEIKSGLFIPYAIRKGFYFDGEYHDPYVNQHRLKFWKNNVGIFDKNIIVVSEKDLKILVNEYEDTEHEDTTINLFEDFVKSDQFLEKAPEIVNDKIYLDSASDRSTMADLLGIFQTYFMKDIYNGSIQHSKLSEQTFYNFVNAIKNEDIKSALLKMISYFPHNDSNKYSRYDAWSFNNFLMAEPGKEYFDNEVIKQLLLSRETAFTLDEIEMAEKINHQYKLNFRSYNDGSTGLKDLINDCDVLKNKALAAKLGTDDIKTIIDSRVNIYMLDLVRLLDVIDNT